MTTRRTTRSQSRATRETSNQSARSQRHQVVLPILPDDLQAQRTGLIQEDHDLLLQKRNLLRSLCHAKRSSIHETAFQSTLVFAQCAAGTAVCISPDGLLLTCAHCVDDEETKFDRSASFWLLFASGRVVETRCIALDTIRDLALLRIIAAQALDRIAGPESLPYSFLTCATLTPRMNASLICIGHPGSEDLEASTAGLSTGYDILHVSEGKYRGSNPDQDPHDNSEIGALMHDCWTYWGHSGAPLIDASTGQLIGLHSSWDDETGMRRGIGTDAIKAFIAGTGIPMSDL